MTHRGPDDVYAAFRRCTLGSAAVKLDQLGNHTKRCFDMFCHQHSENIFLAYVQEDLQDISFLYQTVIKSEIVYDKNNACVR